MNSSIYKYELSVTDRQILMLPVRAEVLTVQMQRGKPCLWARVNPEHRQKETRIHIFGTGHEMPADIELEYISTFQMHDGDLVFHVFKELEK